MVEVKHTAPQAHLVGMEEAMQAAWQFVKPTIIEQSKEDGLAGVWAKAFRSGWDAKSRDCFADGIRAAAALFTTDASEPVDDLTKLTREADRQRILSLITSPSPVTKPASPPTREEGGRDDV